MTDHGFGLAPGDRIREFRIEKELGAGGFGVTYLAWDEELERWVALKEYLPREWGTRRSDGSVGPGFSTDAHYFQWGLTKFLEEARTLARLNHPQIVRVYQVIEARGTAYMAMEYVDGRSLKRELESVGRLGEARVREMLDALMSGLAAVHARGILHRDLKPANVMLGGADGLPVLIDFGAARQNVSRESRSLMSALTPPYAPVEQYETDGDQGPWTDIYALGVLTYECLSGERPAESVSRFRNDTTRPLTDVAPAVSPQLAALVEMALKVDERDRPQDVASWRRMLVEVAPSSVKVERIRPSPSPSPESSWSEPVVAGPSARDSSPSLARDVFQPAKDSSPSLAGRESQPGGESPGSLLGEESQPGEDSSGRLSQPAGDSSRRSLPGEEFHSGRDSEDGQLSGDSSERAPSLAGASGEGKRKPRWAILAAGVGVAAVAGVGLWFAIGAGGGGSSPPQQPVVGSSAGVDRTVAGQVGMSETGNGGGLAAPALAGSGLPSSAGPEEDDGTVSEIASTPLPREVDNPPQDPSPTDPSPAEGTGAPPAESSPAPPEAVNPPPETETPSQPEEVTPPAAAEDAPGPILPAPGTTFQDCTPGEACALPLMVVIPPPGRSGTVPTAPLAVSVHELTVGQWRACAEDANSCDPRVLDREGNVHPDGTFPVVAVTWDDAQAYVAWLSRNTGQPYRLLSEAEWEYMARAGTQTGRYWDNESELCRYANAWDITAHNSIDNSTRAFADCEDSYANTAPVGSFTANSFGVHDALGNVEEWVQNRVVRGGSWRDGPEQLRAERRSELRTVRSSYVGFRVALMLN